MVDEGGGAPAAKFDLARLAEISGGDVEFEQEIAGEYLAQARELCEQAARALETHDAVALSRAAHTLKGSSRTVGAEGVAQLAAELEASAADSTQAAASSLARARACLVASERELDRHFGTDRYRKAA